jgi:hypothetical protein
VGRHNRVFGAICSIMNRVLLEKLIVIQVRNFSLLWNQEVYYRLKKCLPLVPINMIKYHVTIFKEPCCVVIVLTGY